MLSRHTRETSARSGDIYSPECRMSLAHRLARGVGTWEAHCARAAGTDERCQIRGDPHHLQQAFHVVFHITCQALQFVGVELEPGKGMRGEHIVPLPTSEAACQLQSWHHQAALPVNI